MRSLSSSPAFFVFFSFLPEHSGVILNLRRTQIDDGLLQIDSERGNLGVIQNRFESIISNLQNVAENIAAAKSRIMDADITKEPSEMTKQNILQQAGVSILTQANQQPQLALSLRRI